MVHPGRNRFAVRQIVGRLLASCFCMTAMASFAVSAEMSIAQKVHGHLAAGEFGQALALATAAPSLDEKTSLINQIADAQRASGEVESASGTLRRVPATQQNAMSRLPQSGGQAQFGMLMMLIQQNTKGKWENIDGEGGAMTPFQTGVRVAPNGLLHKLSKEEFAGQLSATGLRARHADLNNEVARKSELRMVSLTRLEKAVARRIEEGMQVPETMAQLAGLLQVKYVFVYPESNEIVIAGPANGWEYNNKGQSVSLNDGRPTLQLDDLVTVLRTFAGGNADFGCSINTRDEGVKALKGFVESSQKNGAIDSRKTRDWVKQLQQELGRQDVVVWGVPQDSRVARVIVEADYRMKLIGIDRLDAGKEIPSYFDLLPVAQQKSSPEMQALRWWLTMQFDGVLHSEDKNAFEIQGSSVLCQSENQLLTAEGKHLPTGQSEPTNRLFAQNFTANYGKLAVKDLVFADTQNIFDLALCSALIKHERLNEKAGWDMGVFAPNGAYTTASYPVPKEIDSVVNHRVYRGRDIVVQVAGGVTANVMSVAKDPKLNKSEPELDGVGNNAKAPQLPEGRWWWDSVK